MTTLTFFKAPPPDRARASVDVAAAAQLACLLEASAPKPGNVSRDHHFTDIRYEHFLASAAAIGGPLAGAHTRRLGATIRLATEATMRWAPSNTNLGIVLLLAPLARAALVWQQGRDVSTGAGTNDDESMGGALVPSIGPTDLRNSLCREIDTTSIHDARDVYSAIRLAAPGGLGRVDTQDVSEEPTVTLLEAMRMAAQRDSIASEYATGFEITFERSVPALQYARTDGLSWDDAVVETFLALLAAAPDSHVARRGGEAAAREVSRQARAAIAAGGVRSAAGRQAIDAMDLALRDPHNVANPGTSADLTAAAIFVVLLGGGWHAGHGGCDAPAR
jgi:triphosphoribosyl-dephospho-CoA synthase